MELRILSGLHRGAVMELDDASDAIAIGSSPGGDLDVLLADNGIAKRHGRLLRQANRWHIEPLQGKVFDAQGRELAAATAIERGQAVRLGDVWLGFFDAADPWKDASSLQAASAASAAPMARYPQVKAPLLAAAVCAMAIPAAWFATTAWGNVASLTAPAAPASTAIVAAAPQPPASPAKLAEEFTRALAERDLKERLDLQLGPEHWEIRGSLDGDERQRFERLLLRFTEAHQPTFSIKVSLVTPAELLPFKVVEVITGKGASIVTDAGERLQVGDAHQGWKLLSVESGKVTFQGRQRVEVVL